LLAGLVLVSCDVSATEALAAKFAAIFPHLDERQRRLLMGAEARAIGRGGIRLVARAAGVREATVSLGASELDSGEAPLGRVRRPGGGRKRVIDLNPELRTVLLALIKPDMRDDPRSPMRWTTKSTHDLAGELTRQGHRVSADTVGDLLRKEGFNLKANAKTIEGRHHPDRDGQFRYINEQAKAHFAGDDPVIGVDTTKKELVGADNETGTALSHASTEKASWVDVSTDQHTARLAVESIRRWWNDVGATAHPAANRLLITTHAGDSTSHHTHAWKTELAAFADETGMTITVCHLPPGTSKWNKIEHRLFSHIRMSWLGRRLTCHEVNVDSVAATIASTGPTVHTGLDTADHGMGSVPSDTQPTHLAIAGHDWHGDWNYSVYPS
jgi:hypothetical protein